MRLIALGEEDLVGQEIDERYKVLKKLGQGGMGAVYVAEQSLIGRRVALKVLLKAVVKDESIVKRFLIEARAIAALSNQHTITLYDFGVTAAGLLYFTMELVEGIDLSKILKREGPLGYERATSGSGVRH
ncbi:MAG: protein kinase [Pseudomonadota bacterium]